MSELSESPAIQQLKYRPQPSLSFLFYRCETPYNRKQMLTLASRCSLLLGEYPYFFPTQRFFQYTQLFLAVARKDAAAFFGLHSLSSTLSNSLVRAVLQNYFSVNVFIQQSACDIFASLKHMSDCVPYLPITSLVRY